MPISTALQNQIEAIQARIDAIMPEASPEDVVMLAKAVEAVGGQATVFDVIETGETEKAEVVALADAKKAELVTTGDTQANRVVAQGELKLGELSQEVQKYAVFGGAASEANGALGMVPAPQAGDESKYLQASGEWRKPGEIPIGGIALIHPNMDTTGFLPANGGTVLITDYPELFEVLGQAPNSLSGGPFLPSTSINITNEVCGGSSSYRAACVNGDKVIVLRSGSSGLQWSQNGGLNWSQYSFSLPGNNGNFLPAISDSGRTFAFFGYGGSSPYYVRLHGNSAAIFGAWAGAITTIGSEQLETPHNDLMTIGLPTGVAATGKKKDATQVIFLHYADGGTSREINLSLSVDARITNCRGLLRVGSSLFLMVDNGGSWNAIIHTTDAGENWTTIWSGNGAWSTAHNSLSAYNSVKATRQDAGQASYFENGIGFIQHGNAILTITEAGEVTQYSQPDGHMLINGSIHYVDGFYYAASGSAVFRTTNFIAWEVLATSAQISGTSPSTISSMYVHRNSGSFAFYFGGATFSQTKDFSKYRRSARPRTWGTSFVIRNFAYSQGRFIKVVIETSSNSKYYDCGIYDIKLGILYAGGFTGSYHSSYTPSFYWDILLPNERWLTHRYYSSYVLETIGISDLYNYNTNNEFRLPVSSGAFCAVGAYGNQSSWPQNNDWGNRAGFEYYVRAK